MSENKTNSENTPVIAVKRKYISLAAKKEIIDIIVANSIKTNDYGMKQIDYVRFDLSADMSLLQFYCDVDLNTIDMDTLYEDGTIGRIKGQIPDYEIDYIFDKAGYEAHDLCDTYNSLAGVLERSLTKVIEKIPDEKAMKSILNKIPKTLDKIDPRTTEVLQSIINGKLK